MKKFLAVIAIIVALAAVSGSEAAETEKAATRHTHVGNWSAEPARPTQKGANRYTYVSNWSAQPIRATTSYQVPGAHSRFVDRFIGPYTWDRDEYWLGSGRINIEVWIQGAVNHGSVTVDADRSIVAYDQPVPGSQAVEIFLVTYGKLVEIDEGHKEKLTTIYPW